MCGHLVAPAPPHPNFLESRPPVSSVTLSPQSQSSSYAHLSASSPGSELLLGGAVVDHPVVRCGPGRLSHFYCGVIYLRLKAQILKHPV